MSSRRGVRLIYFFIAVLVVPLAVFAAAELILSALPSDWFTDFAFYARGVDDDLIKYSFLQPDPHLLWRPRPSARQTVTAGKRSFSVEIGPDGWRDRLMEIKPGDNCILALGDSVTFGLWVSANEAYPAVLQHQLNSRASAVNTKVINMGVPGYTTLQGLLLLNREGLKLNPAIVTVCFGINDPVLSYFLSDKEILDRLTRLPETRRLMHRSRIYLLLRRGILKMTAQNKSPVPRVSRPEFSANLEAIWRLAQQREFHLVMIVPPVGGRLAAEQLKTVLADFRAAAIKNGVPLLDIPELDYTHAKFNAAYFADQLHPNAAGQRLIGQRLYRLLLGLNWLSPN